MAKDNNLKDLLTDVADAIREKKGTTELINPQDFGEEIRGIESGGGECSLLISDALYDNTGDGIRNLTDIVVTEGVTSLIYGAYRHCTITSIKLPSSLTTLEDYAFNSINKLKELNIPDSVTSIGSYCFQASKIPVINLPRNLTTLKNSAFESFQTNSPMIVPPTLTSIPTNAWAYINGVPYYSFFEHTTVPTLANTTAMGRNTDTTPIYVPDALYDEWINATNWSALASRIVKASDFKKQNNE